MLIIPLNLDSVLLFLHNSKLAYFEQKSSLQVLPSSSAFFFGAAILKQARNLNYLRQVV